MTSARPGVNSGTLDRQQQKAAEDGAAYWRKVNRELDAEEAAAEATAEARRWSR